MSSFNSAEERETLARRLMQLAEHMVRCRDQGHNHMIRPTDQNIGDIQAAAVCVLESPVKEPSS